MKLRLVVFHPPLQLLGEGGFGTKRQCDMLFGAMFLTDEREFGCCELVFAEREGGT